MHCIHGTHCIHCMHPYNQCSPTHICNQCLLSFQFQCFWIWPTLKRVSVLSNSSMDIFCLRDRQYSDVVLTLKFPTESKECKFPSAIFQCKYQCIFPMQISFAISNANFQCNFQCKFLMQFPMQISNANFQCKFHLQFSLHSSMQSPLHTCLQNKYTGAANAKAG